MSASVSSAVRQDGGHHNAAEVGAARNLDLVLDGGLDQQADEVVLLEHRTGGDDRPGDLNLVEGQHIDQGGRRPVGGGELLGQAAADVALGLDHQLHEDRGQQVLHGGDLVSRRGFTGVAQVDDGQQQALAVGGRPALGEVQNAVATRGEAQAGSPISLVLTKP
jgi:hypothetical protein